MTRPETSANDAGGEHPRGELSAAERRHRRIVVANTIHAHATEGIELEDDMLAQLDRYAAGEASAGDLVTWARRSMGLPDDASTS